MGLWRQGVGLVMASEWDDTPWGGTAPAKVETGSFVSRIEYGIPISTLNRSPQKRMREAQALYHSNPWIHTAEATVTRKVVGLDWHLEDENDDEVNEGAAGIAGAVQLLMERPQALLSVGRKMTRRGMWSLLSRHMGLCGVSYLYLDQMEPTARTPLGLLYVNPARVWPSTDDAGNLTGWVIDAKDDYGRGGTPLEIDELLPVYLEEPDYGYYPSGLVEAAWMKAQITTLADRHTAYILGTGGRIPGIVSPKEGTIPDEAYKVLVNEFRNVNESPDAAKRTTIVRGPIDYTTTASDPSELMITAMATMNRDDILAIWGVPPSQAGVPPVHGGGLNSGEAHLQDETVMMQGSVHDRVVAIVEAIQYGLLDRYKKLGYTFDLEVEESDYDDDTPFYENAAKALNIPLTNDERREIIGKPPLEDPVLGAAIILPITLTTYEKVAAPPVLPPVLPPPVPEAAIPTKADAKFLGLRSRVQSRFVPRLRKSVADVLATQKIEVASRVRSHGVAIARKPKDSTIWWYAAKEDERLAKVLRTGASGIATTVARQIGDLMGTKAAPVSYEDAVVTFVDKRTAKRVTEINATTREAIQAAILDGFEQGLSPSQVGDLIEGLPAFDEARAELVARTETMFAYNDAALSSYGEFGVSEVLAYDGDGDEECAARDGQTFSVDEAYSIEDHPNGTLDWAPVVEGRAYLDIGKAVEVESKALIEARASVETMGAMLHSFAQPPIVNVPAPIVNIEAAAPPIVNVEPPIVNIEAAKAVVVNVPEMPAPIVNMDMAPMVAAFADLAAELRASRSLAITSMPSRVTRREVTKRNKDQSIAETIEVETDA